MVNRCNQTSAKDFLLVIGTSTELVGRTIHQPCHVQLEAPTEHGGHKPGAQQSLVPAVVRDERRQNEAAQRHQYMVVPGKVEQP